MYRLLPKGLKRFQVIKQLKGPLNMCICRFGVPPFYCAVLVRIFLIYFGESAIPLILITHHLIYTLATSLVSPFNLIMPAHDDFESDKDLPLESGGSESSSTLLHRADPWNHHVRKSSRSFRRRQICSYQNWLMALNALIFLTTIGLWTIGTFARKSEACHCDTESWTTKFEEDCKDKNSGSRKWGRGK